MTLLEENRRLARELRLDGEDVLGRKSKEETDEAEREKESEGVPATALLGHLLGHRSPHGSSPSVLVLIGQLFRTGVSVHREPFFLFRVRRQSTDDVDDSNRSRIVCDPRLF